MHLREFAYSSNQPLRSLFTHDKAYSIFSNISNKKILPVTRYLFCIIISLGVHNLTAMGNLIQWQKVEYDFQFSKVEMETDVVRILLFLLNLGGNTVY